MGDMRVWVTVKPRYWKGTSKQECRRVWRCSLGTLGGQKEASKGNKDWPVKWSRERWKPRGWRAEHQVESISRKRERSTGQRANK